jgi:hypothetical protein
VFATRPFAGKAAGEEKGWPNQHKKLRGARFYREKNALPNPEKRDRETPLHLLEGYKQIGKASGSRCQVSSSNPKLETRNLKPFYLAISLSNSSTLTAGQVVKAIPVILLRATEALIACSIRGKVRIKSRSFSPRSAYIAFTLPPYFLTRTAASLVRLALIFFTASAEYFPNIKNVAI